MRTICNTSHDQANAARCVLCQSRAEVRQGSFSFRISRSMQRSFSCFTANSPSIKGWEPVDLTSLRAKDVKQASPSLAELSSAQRHASTSQPRLPPNPVDRIFGPRSSRNIKIEREKKNVCTSDCKRTGLNDYTDQFVVSPPRTEERHMAQILSHTLQYSMPCSGWSLNDGVAAPMPRQPGLSQKAR